MANCGLNGFKIDQMVEDSTLSNFDGVIIYLPFNGNNDTHNTATMMHHGDNSPTYGTIYVPGFISDCFVNHAFATYLSMTDTQHASYEQTTLLCILLSLC